MIKLIQGDCLDKLKELEENSVDSIVTDPPYELGFMGKKWDNTGIANNKEMWAECLRVLKPGGHLLAFSGTRTYHRMASAIEDAGFEVRDMIEWVYGSGFPKSLNIAKQLNKMEGQNEIVKQWEGWGTALKPAHEPICMARKPLSEKTVAENCLKWGTGGINIDESRVDGKTEIHSNGKRSMYGGNSLLESKTHNDKTEVKDYGRFPANLIHDNSEEVRECFPESKSSDAIRKNNQSKNTGIENGASCYGKYNDCDTFGYSDSGNASRFFRAIPQVVDLNDFSIYNRSILTNIKQLCGQHLTKKKTGIMLGGVIQEVEKFIQDAELLISGNSTMEKFLTDTAFTIKTLTAQMTELRTLNVLPNWLITKFTEESEKTTNSLKELNTEDVKSAKNIFPLQTFISEVLESIRAIAEIVAEQDSSDGERANDNSRFFKSIIYNAKASKSERNKGCEDVTTIENGKIRNGNIHSTVKPIALMEYLIKMVTPKGGTVLDPFMGSGSTGIAAKKNGYDFIGIEMEEAYIEIAKKRIEEA